MLIAVLFRTIEALNKSFDLVMGMTGGGPGTQTEVVAVNLYRQAFQGQWRHRAASALAYIVLIIIIAISNLYISYLNKMQGRLTMATFEETGPRSPVVIGTRVDKIRPGTRNSDCTGLRRHPPGPGWPGPGLCDGDHGV